MGDAAGDAAMPAPLCAKAPNCLDINSQQHSDSENEVLSC